jgi:hypothetical protein
VKEQGRTACHMQNTGKKRKYSDDRRPAVARWYSPPADLSASMAVIQCVSASCLPAVRTYMTAKQNQMQAVRLVTPSMVSSVKERKYIRPAGTTSGACQCASDACTQPCHVTIHMPRTQLHTSYLHMPTRPCEHTPMFAPCHMPSCWNPNSTSTQRLATSGTQAHPKRYTPHLAIPV